ncbi:MAG: glycosyltransferase family 4 protein [Sphaerospermopsis sp. SIO1G2]|nr:glycosyltransferase family 4 protein [Sphaerospermopsis sp. SIO1G2]
MAFCPKKQTISQSSKISKGFNSNQNWLDILKNRDDKHEEISQQSNIKQQSVSQTKQETSNLVQPHSQKNDLKLKVSIITEFYPPDYAATGQLIEELARQLELQGVKLEVFTGQPGYAFSTANAPALEKTGSLRIQRSRSTQVWSGRIRGKAVNGVLFTLRAFLHLIRNHDRHNIFLVTSAPPFLPVAAYLAHLCLGIPYVCLIYDLYPDIAIALGVIPKNNWLAKFWRELNRKIWSKSKGIVVLSPDMKDRVVLTCPNIAEKVSVNLLTKLYFLANQFLSLLMGTINFGSPQL